ncbi:hypothetical protein M5E06_10425 [Azospirillum sp. A1-3]|uniref:hypothetical protein n=1 Tax=Azospirillum sp. A1-3 TaxID=185874 RepID=UPI00207714C3|nr:hypothetical protein [Azospirillum sp. A1-3]MCM8734609.1 hypothetical protein [Azospirillum sp. A1-3]
MITKRCPPNGLARAAWFLREAAEYEEVGNLERASYCRTVAAGIEDRELHSRPLCALMGSPG